MNVPRVVNNILPGSTAKKSPPSPAAGSKAQMENNGENIFNEYGGEHLINPMYHRPVHFARTPPEEASPDDSEDERGRRATPQNGKGRQTDGDSVGPYSREHSHSNQSLSRRSTGTRIRFDLSGKFQPEEYKAKRKRLKKAFMEYYQ